MQVIEKPYRISFLAVNIAFFDNDFSRVPVRFGKCLKNHLEFIATPGATSIEHVKSLIRELPRALELFAQLDRSQRDEFLESPIKYNEVELFHLHPLLI